MFCILYSGTSCNTSRQVREVVGNYNIIPVYTKSWLDISKGDPRLVNLKTISHAYISSKDSFLITLLDMDENKSFIDSKDVVVVGSVKDSLAPIFPALNINAAFFSPGLVFDFYGTKYQIINASADGKQISIHQIKSSPDGIPQITVTDQISNELMVPEINSTQSYNLLKTIQAQNKKYVLLYFWSPNCTACFENIPKLKKLESSGIGIVNIFYMDDDEITLVEKEISRFDIPGINFRSSPELIKFFSQNGFPYSVLVDASANKMLSSTHRIAEHEKFLNF